MKLQFIIDIATVPPGSLSVKRKAGIQCKSCERLHMKSSGLHAILIPHCQSMYGEKNWGYAKLIYPFCLILVEAYPHTPWRKL